VFSFLFKCLQLTSSMTHVSPFIQNMENSLSNHLPLLHFYVPYRGKQLGVYLPDTDERAMGYLAGPSPNNWGILHDGRHISDLLTKATGSDEERRSHPLFGHVVLLVMQEVKTLCPVYLFSDLLSRLWWNSLRHPRSQFLSLIAATSYSSQHLSIGLSSVLPRIGGQQEIIRSSERGEKAHI
jgi:hypothetical protein